MENLLFSLPHSNKTFAHHRMALVWKYLADQLLEEGINLQAEVIDIKNLPDAQAVVYANLAGIRDLPGIRELKRRGTQLVWQVDDDYWNIPDTNAAKAQIGKVELATLDECLDMADQIWVTTETLANKIGKQFKTSILPNAVDINEYPPFRPRKSHGALWAGSTTHYEDLTLVEKLPTELPNWDFVFVGLLPRALREYVIDPVQCTMKIVPTSKNVGYVSPVAFERYRGVFNQLAKECSVGICPITDNEFNLSKSNLKILEMWAAGLVVVASNAGEYKKTITSGVNGVLVEPGEWTSAVDSVENVGADLAENGYNMVRDNWSWNCEKIKETWLNGIRAAVKGYHSVRVTWG